MKEETRKEIGSRLKEAREYLGISQEEASNAVNIPRPAISLIESGQRKLDSVELCAFAKLYQRPVSYFTEESKPETTNEEISVLARNFSSLSEKDKKELIQFAEFLSQKGKN
jgi:transcriptional regulator with XRE-family HTH domain